MHKNPIFSTDVHAASELLRQGKLVAFPTETVYGLGAHARNIQAVERIFSVKGRPVNHPLIVHIAHIDALHAWAREVSPTAWRLAQAFWPGPLTLILPRHRDVPDVVTGGLDTVAVRIPSHPMALELLKTLGDGIAAPSANKYGHVSPTSALDVYQELSSGVDFILDGGRCAVGIESTIVDATTSEAILLRPGGITQEQINTLLNTPVARAIDTRMPHPGDKPSHYAPKARVILASWEDVKEKINQVHPKRVGLLASQRPEDLDNDVTWLRMPKRLDAQAHELYHALRQADAWGLEVVVAIMPQEQGLGYALCDRLRKAAGLG